MSWKALAGSTIYRGLGNALGRLPAETFLRTWLRGAVAASPPPAEDLWRHREAMVRRLAPGKSFLDLGGMYEVAGRVAFLAEECGASRVVLMDALDPSEPFEREHQRRGSDVKYVQGDLHDEAGIRELGQFDVVWCAGILYHTPDPWRQLHHLRLLTADTLMLGTHVIPELPGIPHGCLFYPELDDGDRQVFADIHGEGGRNYWGIAGPFTYEPEAGYVNFWWGMSRSAVRAMLRVAAFDVVEQHDFGAFFVDIVARPQDRPSVLPATDAMRSRHAERVRRHAEGSGPRWL